MIILKRLTIKDLGLNKKRTIGTLIGIILSTALITVVGGMFFTFQNTLLQGTINNGGYYHIQLSDISEEQANTVKNNKDFSNLETVYDLGYSVENLGQNDSFTSHLYSMDKETAEYLKYNIKEGEFPKNSSEVLISKEYKDKMNVKIGDNVKLVCGYMADKNGKILKSTEYRTYEFTVVRNNK